MNEQPTLIDALRPIVVTATEPRTTAALMRAALELHELRGHDGPIQLCQEQRCVDLVDAAHESLASMLVTRLTAPLAIGEAHHCPVTLRACDCAHGRCQVLEQTGNVALLQTAIELREKKKPPKRPKKGPY